MTAKLSFQEVQDMCAALGAFADARTQGNPEDLILTIKKIHGKKVLQTTRLSKMPWNARLVRSFGFGESSLESVAYFLHEYEPYLCSNSEESYYRKRLSCHYTEEAVDQFVNMEKEALKTLRTQKIKGCEAFKKCISDHNELSSRKVYLVLNEPEKEDLNITERLDIDGITYSWPNPMGFLHHEDTKALCESYKAPVIDASEFPYMHSFFINNRMNVEIPPKILGFCYEYGLGAKKDLKLAIQHYQIAAEDNQYSACYNLARLILREGDAEDAIDVLKKAEKILLAYIDNVKKYLPTLQKSISKKEKKGNQNQRITRKSGKIRVMELDKIIEQQQESQLKKALKTWDKDLRKIYLAFIEIYTKTYDDLLREEYEKKANSLAKTP